MSARFSRVHLAGVALGLSAAPALAGPQPQRILWRFDLATAFSGTEVQVGPDGTVYASDNLQLYALSPGGDVLWTRPGAGGGTPISFLDDGGIIVGLGVTVYALNPDGTTRWTFTYDGNGLHEQIEVGPSVGPDGNVYGVTSVDDEGHGLGAFSLTPDGELRWSDEGDPPLDLINGSSGGRVFFTQERMVFRFRFTGDGPGLVYGFDFDGNQTLVVDFTCTGPARTDPLNRVLIASACGIEALEQDGNESFWTVDLGPVNLAPAIGDDATVYSANWLGDVRKISPAGEIIWTSEDATLAETMLAVRPDVGRLVYAGGGFGVPNFVKGVETADGSVAWSVDLATIDGHNELMWTPIAPTSADGSVVYFSTRFTSNGVPGAVYAVRVTDEPATACPGDLDRSGRVDMDDLVALITSWGPCAGCGADLDGDGVVAVNDLVALVLAWGSCG